MKFAITAACLGLFLGTVWATWPASDALPPPATVAAPVQQRPVAPDHAVPARQWMSNLPVAQGRGDSTPAWISMAGAREHGDNRTPPLQARAVADSAPSAAQLGDRAAYRAYEQDQHARVLAAFALAAEAELPRLRADVERGRAAGIAREDILKVEAKIRRLERTRRGIVENGVVPPD
jgi:hypothetical protein